MIFMAFPIRVFKRNQISVTQEIGKRDKHINDALVAAGFNLDKGPDSSGFFMKYLERGGGKLLLRSSRLALLTGSRFRLLSRCRRLRPDQRGRDQTQTRPRYHQDPPLRRRVRRQQHARRRRDCVRHRIREHGDDSREDSGRRRGSGH